MVDLNKTPVSAGLCRLTTALPRRLSITSIVSFFTGSLHPAGIRPTEQSPQ